MTINTSVQYILNRITVCVISWLTVATANAVTIPNVPLLTSTASPPNIMMILDDSGSMQWEMLPDDVTVGYYVFPRKAGIYGGSEYENRTPSTDDNEAYNAVTRSPQVNKIYYNPAVTYRPWSKSDGSLMANAPSGCAPHNPADSSIGCRDLTNTNSQTANWVGCSSATNCYYTAFNANKSFWPATYFQYNGGSIWNWDNYSKYEIKSSTTTYTGEGRTNRSDCAINNACTYAEEIQNFANWYTYYRSRILTARAGIGRAFASQGGNLRPGFSAINKGSTSIDGVSTRTVISGVRDFTGSNRTDFFNNLYDHPIPALGTPLRRALDDVGNYFSRTDAQGPWSTTPGATGGTELVCRQSYTILMTDGYWNGAQASTSGARDNNDGTNGSTITGTNSQTYTYSATSPFTDTYSNTLADIAMHYWNRDLRTDIANSVPTNFRDPAFWQHMVTFGVGLGVSGSVNPTEAFTAIDTGASINWPNPIGGGNAALLDDLVHASVNGRGGFFSAANPEEFASALTNTLNDIVQRTGSASNISSNSTSINTGSQVFQAKFESGKWNGDLEAFPVSATGTGITPTWKASEHIPAPNSRNIFTTSGGAAVAFSWLALSATDQTNLGNADVLNYLRGVRSKELQNGGSFRNRASNNILGDIVHSSPYYVKNNDTIYVGANDGMLHAFNASSGQELFAYIPSAVIANLKSLSQPSYLHNYFVDGDIAVSNQSQTTGKNYLVSTLGHGGKGLFGLDVSAPSSFGANNVLWEYTGSSDVDLGYMLGQPLIAQMNNGSWVAIVGNGYNSTSGKSVLYIFDLITGNLIRKIDTGIAGDNGMASPGVFDNNNDGKIDLIYAGDLKGNVWKFDVSDATPSNWNIAFSSQPLFTTKDSTNTPQPITAPMIVVKNDLVGDLNIGKRFIFFGSGSLFRSGDLGDTQVNSWYGLIDDDLIMAPIADKSELIQRSIAEEGFFGGRPVRTFNSATPGDMAGKKGWYLDFSTKSGERVVTSSTFFKAVKPALEVSSNIPVVNPCVSGGVGFSNVIAPFSGASLDTGFFDINQNGTFADDKLNGRFIGGFSHDIGLQGKSVLIGGLLVVGGSTGGLGSIHVNLGSSKLKGRLSWREIISD